MAGKAKANVQDDAVHRIDDIDDAGARLLVEWKKAGQLRWFGDILEACERAYGQFKANEAWKRAYWVKKHKFSA